MSDITYSVGKGKVIIHKDGANLALTLPQIQILKNILPLAEDDLLIQQELEHANGKKRS